MSRKFIHSLLSLRPHEFSAFMTEAKILKKYNRLKRSKKYEKAFTEIFKDTPYPFSWTLFYDRAERRRELSQEILDECLVNEKKVLFFGFQNKI